jgi:UDP-N-acetylglucosamine acyltransferase
MRFAPEWPYATIPDSCTVHPAAELGNAPEHRGWTPEMGVHKVLIGEDCRISAGVTVDAGYKDNTVVGDRTMLMAKVHIGHDAQIGADCEIAPLSSVGGHVRIGDRVRVGQGAVFRPFVTVGDGARIGCGAVVVSDVPAGEVWAGNPARKLR